MNKQELRYLYKQGKLTTKEYFLQLSFLIRDSFPQKPIESSEPNVILDGKLPIY